MQLAFSGCMCLIMTIRKGIEGRKQTLREEERERNLEEGREMLVAITKFKIEILMQFSLLEFDKTACECNKRLSVMLPMQENPDRLVTLMHF